MNNKVIVKNIYDEMSKLYDTVYDWLDNVFDSNTNKIKNKKLLSKLDYIRWGIENARDNIDTELENMEKILEED